VKIVFEGVMGLGLKICHFPVFTIYAGVKIFWPFKDTKWVLLITSCAKKSAKFSERAVIIE